MDASENNSADYVRIPSLDRLRQHNTDVYLEQDDNAAEVKGANAEDTPKDIVSLVVEVALCNMVRYPWADMKPLYHMLLDRCIDQYQVEVSDEDETAALGERLKEGVPGGDGQDDTEIIIPKHQEASLARAKNELHELLDSFNNGPPFTIQRLSEIVLEPKKQYKSREKLIRGLGTVLGVTSVHMEEFSEEKRKRILGTDIDKIKASSMDQVNETPAGNKCKPQN
jgi:hypothetical protein